jgi:hypothetical protein
VPLGVAVLGAIAAAVGRVGGVVEALHRRVGAGSPHVVAADSRARRRRVRWPTPTRRVEQTVIVGAAIFGRLLAFGR